MTCSTVAAQSTAIFPNHSTSLSPFVGEFQTVRLALEYYFFALTYKSFILCLFKDASSTNGSSSPHPATGLLANFYLLMSFEYFLAKKLEDRRFVVIMNVPDTKKMRLLFYF
jgi:hypothetical protein